MPTKKSKPKQAPVKKKSKKESVKSGISLVKNEEERIFGTKELLHGLLIGFVIGFIIALIVFKGGL